MSHQLSDDQLNTLRTVEYVASALSVLGIATIIGTFCLSRHFRNAIHRLIFINAFYNSFDVAATLISLSGPSAGNGSALCQFQGFLLQMFPVADVLWTFAMACDVFLIVFYRYDGQALRRLEFLYTCVITTVTFIPALTFLFIHTADKGYMYGSVTLWCAISPNWVLFRIILYYAPIWLFIFISMILYILIGLEIFKRKQAFKAITSDAIPLDTVASPTSSYRTNTWYSDNSHNAGASSFEADHRSHPRSFVELRDPAGEPAVSNQSSMSFRQYILMPLMIFIVLLAIWVAPTVNRVATLVNPSYVSYPLLLAVGAAGSLRGFWNGLVFITLGMKARKRQRGLERAGVSSRG